MLSDYILDSWKHTLTIAMGGTVVHKEHIYISCARLSDLSCPTGTGVALNAAADRANAIQGR